MIKSFNVAWWVERWAALEPEKIALVFENQCLSYASLHRRVSRSACLLQEFGIEKGDRVAVLLGNCPEFVELYTASSRLGAIFVPLNFRLSPSELDYLIGNCRPRALVFGKAFQHLVDGVRERHPRLSTLCVDSSSHSADVQDYTTLVQAREGCEPFLSSSLGPSDPEEPHVIMYTSGTTGRPKGAVLSHRKTFFNCLNADAFFDLSYHDVLLVTLPLFHSGGLFIAATPSLYKGATMVLMRRFDPIEVFSAIERFRVTRFLGVPTIFRSLLAVPQEKRGDVSTLRLCAVGGEHVSNELIKQVRALGPQVRQIFGQTETSILLWSSEEDAAARPGTVGRPVFHAEVEVIDEKDRPVPPGQTGEIAVRGSILMKEYWNDPQETERTMRGGWLHTGDLARRDEDGYYYLVDRAKDMFISGGENVYPAEVERVIKRHPDVLDAAVIGVPDEKWGETGHAFVICREGAQPDEQAILEICSAELARFKIPRSVTFIEEFPRTSLGKVRKYALKEILASHKE